MPRPSPYSDLPPRAFWRHAVADQDLRYLPDLWQPKTPVLPGQKIVTAGSCFAQHLGRALAARGLTWHITEPPPPDLPADAWTAAGYGLFSARTGNIYTAAMLRQWVSWALGGVPMPREIWAEGARYYDPFRPSTPTEGFASRADLEAARRVTLAAFAQALREADWFIFTMGLTEYWQNRHQAYAYPTCPGTVRGQFRAADHLLRNQSFAEACEDMEAVFALIRQHNPRIRFLLTVSPVPLTATATGAHVLVASTYGKSLLRTVAGDLSNRLEDVDYFPSYELISAFPFGGWAYEANKRSVSPAGVAFVMDHFFGQQPALPALAPRAAPAPARPPQDILCDDDVLDYYQTR